MILHWFLFTRVEKTHALTHTYEVCQRVRVNWHTQECAEGERETWTYERISKEQYLFSWRIARRGRECNAEWTRHIITRWGIPWQWLYTAAHEKSIKCIPWLFITITTLHAALCLERFSVSCFFLRWFRRVASKSWERLKKNKRHDVYRLPFSAMK